MIKRVFAAGLAGSLTLTLSVAATHGSAPLPGNQHHRHVAGTQWIDAAEYPPELVEQLATLRAATARFRDHRVAVDEGYERVAGDGPLMGEHWVRRDLVDRPFDVSLPSTLQYLEVDGEYLLTGVAYTVYRAPHDPIPEGFVGDHDTWHVHDMIKIAMTATEGRPLLRWLTERRIAGGRTQWSKDRPELTMVHAWVWTENPDGVFAQDHRLIPYLRVGLPREWGVDSSLDAAHGVALLDERACGLELRRISWLAGTSRRQRRDLTDACREAQARVHVALGEIEDPRPATDATTFNGAAGEAWRGYLERRSTILTEQQVARLAAGIEHPQEHGERSRR